MALDEADEAEGGAGIVVDVVDAVLPPPAVPGFLPPPRNLLLLLLPVASELHPPPINP
jgi:hypothetical protein